MQSDMELLKKEFYADMKRILNETIDRYYYPARFAEMLSGKRDVIVAVKDLINRKDNPEGFTKLYIEGGVEALDLSIEAVVISEKYKPLFTEEERKICIDRLTSCNYPLSKVNTLN